MGSVSPIQLLIVLALGLLLFGGRGKISAVMGDLAKGIQSFRKGLKEEEAAPQPIADQNETIDGTAKPAPSKTETENV